MEKSSNTIRKEVKKGPVTVDKVYVSDFQKEGTKSAQLRQVINVKAYYPTKQISNEMQDNPFGMTDFGFVEEMHENNENRVAWIDIPEAITSVDDVLAKLPLTSTLYKVMSNRPILTSNQAYAVEEGIRTMDDFANSQIIRYGEKSEYAGQIVKDNNDKPQYRQIFYSKTHKEDVDLRTNVAEDFYASEEIRAELFSANVIAGQEL